MADGKRIDQGRRDERSTKRGRGRTTCDLRRLRLRLRLRGLIERIPFTRRYRVTDDDLRTVLCYPPDLRPRPAPRDVRGVRCPAALGPRLNRAVDSFNHEIQRLWDGYGLAA